MFPALSAMSILSSTTSVEWVVLGAVALYGVNRFTLANWPLWYFLGMRGAHNPICYLRGALGDAGAAGSPRGATYRPMPAVNVP